MALRDRAFVRPLAVLLGCMVLTEVVVIVSGWVPSSIQPYIAMTFVMGMLFGPWGALGVDLVSLIRNTTVSYAEPSTLAMDLVMTFLVAYIPYRIWYSTSLGGDMRPPVLDSTRNMAKFFGVMVASGLLYMVMYNLMYGYIDGFVSLNIQDLAMFLNMVSFSLILGILSILVCRYLGIRFWTPSEGRASPLARIPGHVFDVCLVLGLIVPFAITELTGVEHLTAATVMAYAMAIVFCLKPVRPAVRIERPSDQGFKVNRFDASMFDRIAIIFVTYGLLLAAIIIAAYDVGLLAAIPGIESHIEESTSTAGQTIDEIVTNVSLLIYMGIALLAFFAPALVFLKYMEDSVVTPIGEMSEAAREFVSPDTEMSNDRMAEICSPYVNRNSEIGNLARSLDKMASDMVDYVEDIRNLNEERQAMQAELSVARRIQQDFVPKDDSVIAGHGITVAGLMDAAKFVGGDLYDFFPLPDGKVAIAVADVSGKGVPAALFMSITKILTEGRAGQPGTDPGRVFSEVNDSLSGNNNEMMFVTAWLGFIDPSDGSVEFANAGHCPPLVWRSSDGSVEFLKTEPGPALGVFPGSSYKVNRMVLSEGDRILLYTDGVTEANVEYEEFYGSDRLAACAERTSDLDVGDQVAAIREDIRAFVGGAEQFDDITMLLTRYDGPSHQARADHVLIGGAPEVQLLQDREDGHADARQRVFDTLGRIAHHGAADQTVGLQLPQGDREHARRPLPCEPLELVEAHPPVGGQHPQDEDLVLAAEEPYRRGERGLPLGYRVHAPPS